MKIYWQDDTWEIIQYPGRWTLEKRKSDGTFISSVSWFLYFPHIIYFIDFLREQENKTCVYCRKKPSEIEEYIEMAKTERTKYSEIKKGE